MRLRLAPFLGCCLLLLLAAACRQTPRLSPLGPEATVLAFGDSLTSGTGAGETESYPALLAAAIGRPVINAGVPGEVTAEGLARLPQLLDTWRPALLILCHGGNDLLRRRGEEQAAANLRQMVRLARERGVEVVLLGVPQPGLLLAPPAYYQEIADEFGLPYDGETLAGILSAPALKSDPIHPNARGYDRLAAAVAGLLRAAGAL